MLIVAIGLRLLLQPYPHVLPPIWFLFVRPEVCLRLPSDSTSLWTPLPLAMYLPLHGRTRDLHPLEFAHAGRTKIPPSVLKGGISIDEHPYFRETINELEDII